MHNYLPYITRPILVLSLVSLFTDMASEMLYPIMPVFLQSIGFSMVLIGILEGFAEMIAGLSKGYFGKLSDVQRKRLPFVQLGYALSALSKPMMAAFSAPLWIFFARTTDRIGKGLRTAPRDAMLSSMTTPAFKGRVFGFHRSMDTLGAVLGPVLALVTLYFFPGEYTLLFLVAFVPGVIAVLCTFYLREERQPASGVHARVGLFSFLGYLRMAGSDYKRLLAGLLVFALVNSSDVLLLLKMKNSGVPDTTVIMVYIFYNLLYTLAAFPAGIIADKLGLRQMLVLGLCLFAVVYGGFAVTENRAAYWILFGLYGIYAACTEGIAKAWITNITPREEAGTAVGTYAGLSSISAFLASTMAGIVWAGFGPGVAFGISAAVALGVAGYLLRIPYRAHAAA